MKKRSEFKAIAGLILAAMLSFSACPSFIAETSNNDDKAVIFRKAHISNNDMTGKLSETALSGITPILFGFENVSLQNALNTRIEAIITEARSLVTESTRALSFSYDVRIGGSAGEIVSILIFTERTGVTSATSVRSVNFNKLTEKTVKLTSLSVLGVNGIKLANKYIVSQIKATPDKYNDNFNGVNDNVSFSMNANVVTILFDEYVIAPGSSGIVEFSMPKDNIINCYLSKDEYYNQKSNLYNLKMIELKKVTSAFGYSLVWESGSKRVYVYRDKAIVTTLAIGVNEYNKGRMAKRALEAAPEIQNDRTQVPISFFEDILEQSYYVDSMGTITFSEFRTTN